MSKRPARHEPSAPQTRLAPGGAAAIGLSAEAILGPLSELERKFAPKALYVSGPLPIPLSHPRISIVGTRQATRQGLDSSSRLARSLAEAGAIVVSGLAEGIDTAAHRAAIAGGGRTIAVLGTPLSRTYPASNQLLQRTIMEEHLAVSQFPEGYPVTRANFVLRNRTMALLSDATVIIESGETGGSLHQGWEAIRLGRPLFLRSSLLKDPNLRWPGEMANYGALDFEAPEEILSVVPSSAPPQMLDALG